MTRPVPHPLTFDGRDAAILRGDPLTGDRYLSAQETRVRFFHEVLNDYLEDRR